MAARAVASFREQTYQNKRLFILDTGKEEFPIQQGDGIYAEWFPDPCTPEMSVGSDMSIGLLRNVANAYAMEPILDCEIICHFDDDDWSHPNRIAEQVALLQSSGAPAVGYNDCLFWASNRAIVRVHPGQSGPDGNGVLGVVESVGEAWLYRNPNTRYALGTSLCYWRKTWEQKTFEDLPKNGEGTGEDSRWIQGLGVRAVSSFATKSLTKQLTGLQTPRMVASIHGSNTMRYDLDYLVSAGSREWTREAEFDQYCRKAMELK